MTQIGSKCCVDLDDNKLCDLDETEEQMDVEVITEEIPLEKPVVNIESLPKQEKTEITEKTEEEPSNLITGQLTAEPEEKPIITVESPKSEEKPSSETYQFIELYENQNLGYQYLYNTNIHKVKGNKIKVELKLPKKFSSIQINGKLYPLFFVDRIYFNKNTNLATGYCEKEQSCYSEDILDVSLKMDYNKYKEKTPDEWLYEYGLQKPTLFEERKYYVKNRLTTRATYETETGEIRLYYDPKNGLPVRIEEQTGEHPMKITEYFELSAGGIRDIDVVHRTKSEISPEDIFYSTRT